MALLVRIARQSELGEGQKLVKESHGRKILLARKGGKVYATDAHCYHMGGNLWEGDIEDIGGHACVVCPMHRYKIDMTTGQKVDTDLYGCVTCSPGQQQRTYRVYTDPDFICIDIPEIHNQAPLPSDRYNQVAAPLYAQKPQQAGATQPTPGRGLFGSSGGGSRVQQAEPLAPYAGFQHRGLVPGTPAKDMMEDEPALQLSQEASVQFSQEAQSAQKQQMQQQPPAFSTQGQIPFAQSRVDTARIARRKAATAAIAARFYEPPSAPPPARGLFTSGAAPQQQTQQQQQAGAGLARQASGQQSLLSFGFTVQQRSPAPVTTGPEDMEM